MLEASTFKQLLPPRVKAVCHSLNRQVFVCGHRAGNDAGEAQAALLREFAHGFLHRYRSPRRLPAWANEGLAWWAAARALENSSLMRDFRGKAIKHIREGTDLAPALAVAYDETTWPLPGDINTGVCYLLVDLMIREQPEKFRAFVDAIKKGKAWEKALREDFGTTAEQLLEVAAAFYKVND
jgi:hypothetical protein